MAKKTFHQKYVRTVETPIEQTGIDGSFEFDIDAHAPRNNVFEHFYFVDGGGAQVEATAGTVVVTLSSGANIFHTINDGSFNAVDARLATRTKPSGYGSAEKIRIVLAGITGPAVGFVGLVTQSVS